MSLPADPADMSDRATAGAATVFTGTVLFDAPGTVVLALLLLGGGAYLLSLPYLLGDDERVFG